MLGVYIFFFIGVRFMCVISEEKSLKVIIRYFRFGEIVL